MNGTKKGVDIFWKLGSNDGKLNGVKYLALERLITRREMKLRKVMC